MRPFWDTLIRVANARGDADAVALIDADIKQPDQLGLSKLGEKSPIHTFPNLSIGVDEVDSEGFTSQDAGHIAH